MDASPFTARSSLGLCPQCLRRAAPVAQSQRHFHSPRIPISPSRQASGLRQQSQAQSSWAAAAIQKAAQTFLDNGRKNDPVLPGGVKIDPFRSVAKEMKGLTSNMRQLVGSGHPVLDTVSKYYTQAEGKHIRPMLVLLMSQATALTPKQPQQQRYTNHDAIDRPISPSDVLADLNPSIPSLTAEPSTFGTSSSTDSSENILASQRRLAEITELIHTASLLHDDVIDHSTTRRGAPSANMEFGNKMAVLAGDFLLGRASVALARLRHPEVTELLATVIANLIEGEFMQLQNTLHDEATPTFLQGQTLEYYVQKTYLKTASLISKSCRAAALLGDCSPAVVDAAYAYGRNLGLAFQFVDDMLDFSVSAAELGKPSGADLELGLATAPLLFAWQSHPELGPLVGRKFSRPGDVAKVSFLVYFQVIESFGR